MIGLGIFSIVVLVLGSIVLNLLNTLLSFEHGGAIISFLVWCLLVYLAITMTGSLAAFFIILITFIFIAATK